MCSYSVLPACVTLCLSFLAGCLSHASCLFDPFSLYIAVSHMAHVFVYYTLLVVIIICIMFVKLRKCWRMLKSAVSLDTPENSAIQKLSIIIIYLFFGLFACEFSG